MKTKIAVVNRIRFRIISRPIRRKGVAPGNASYEIVGPGRTRRLYESSKDAWIDVLCAHLGECGNRGLISKETANWPEEKIVLKSSN